jgi:hypothetical protein
MTASQPPPRHDAVTTPGSPLRHDGVTTPCPACQHPFTPAGRRRFCSGACRARAYRRRRDAARAAIVIPDARPRRPATVYECGNCGSRASGTSAATRAEHSCAGPEPADAAPPATSPSPSPS